MQFSCKRSGAAEHGFRRKRCSNSGWSKFVVRANMIKLIHHCRVNDCSNNPIPLTPARSEVHFSVLSICVSNYQLVVNHTIPISINKFYKIFIIWSSICQCWFSWFSIYKFHCLVDWSPLIVLSVPSSTHKHYDVQRSCITMENLQLLVLVSYAFASIWCIVIFVPILWLDSFVN